jgi:shikimate kinase
MKKTLYLLVGPKGSGKTHIGTLVSQNTDISFLRVEPIWLSLQPGEDGWKKVEAAIDAAFQSHDQVMVESLGIGAGFRAYCDSLAKKYSLKMIRVYAELDTCLERVKNRDNADHIPVSDDRVVDLNQIAVNVTFDWDLEINNNHLASDIEILAAVKSISNAAE